MNPRTLAVSLTLMMVAGVGLVELSEACRDSTVPLWDLVDSADMVVVADVERVTPSGRSGRMPPFTGLVARLAVRETWKGEAPAFLEVSFNALTTWPAPPAYVEGTRAIALLRRTGGEWTTVGMSSGVIAALPATLEDLRQRVAEAVTLQGKGQVSEADRLDWAVRAAMKPATRAYALASLVPGEAPCQGTGMRPMMLAGRPSQAQLASIAHAFVQDPEPDDTVRDVLILLAGYPDRDVDLAAIHALELALSQPVPPDWTRDAIALLGQRLGEDGLRRPTLAGLRSRRQAGPTPAADAATPDGMAPATENRTPRSR